MSLATAQIRTPNSVPQNTGALAAEQARRAAIRASVNPQQALSEELRRQAAQAKTANTLAQSRQAQRQFQQTIAPRTPTGGTGQTAQNINSFLSKSARVAPQPVVNNAYLPGANYRPVYGQATSIAARNAAAAAGATLAQANATTRAAVPTSAAGALQASPMIGNAMGGVLAAGAVKATGGSWAEAAFSGVGALAGGTLGFAGGTAVALGSLGTGNIFIAGAAPVAGQLGGITLGGELGRRAPSILGRIPGVGGLVANAAGAIVPGAGLLYSGASLLNGWLQPETVAGGAIPDTTEQVDGAPPFTGGQMPGVTYRAVGEIQFTTTNCNTGETSPGAVNATTEFSLIGPLSGLNFTYDTPGLCGSRRVLWTFNTGTGVASGGSFLNPLNNRRVSGAKFVGSFERAGGLPDTGGNPPPDQITAPATSKPRPYNPLEALPRLATPAVVPAPTAPAPNNDLSQTPALRPSAPPTNAPAAPNPAPALPAGDPLVQPAPVTNPTAAPDPTAPPQATPANVPNALPNSTPDIQRALQPGETITLPSGTTVTGTPTGYEISSPTDSPNRLKIPPNQTLEPGKTLTIEDLLNPALAPLLAIPALAIPALLATPTTTTGKVTDPTTPGNFTQAPPQQPTPPIPSPPDTGCRCNGPLLANQAAQAAELAALMAELEKIKLAIGVQGLPASVPNQIAQKNGGQRTISSLAELHLWQVQQLDGVIGQWPIEFGVDTAGGNVGVSIPNVAEAIAEQMGILTGLSVNSAQILNTSSRTLAQAGSATQQAHLAHLTAKANADFLGYESRSTAVDMPLAYTPGKDPFDGLLTESVAKIQGFQNADGQDIKQIFAELLQAAAIIRAVYWRRLDPRSDLKKQIQRNIKGGADFIDQAAAGGGDDNDWEAYLRQVEEGFRSATGDDTPYGRNPSEGPQIKDRSPKKDDK